MDTACYVRFLEKQYAFEFALFIIIMSCHPHRYPWPSLATFPYRSSPPAGLLDYIPYLHIAAVSMFELVVLLLLGHKWGSMGVHQLWAPLCFSSSVLRTCFFENHKSIHSLPEILFSFGTATRLGKGKVYIQTHFTLFKCPFYVTYCRSKGTGEIHTSQGHFIVM